MQYFNLTATILLILVAGTLVYAGDDLRVYTYVQAQFTEQYNNIVYVLTR